MDIAVVAAVGLADDNAVVVVVAAAVVEIAVGHKSVVAVVVYIAVGVVHGSDMVVAVDKVVLPRQRSIGPCMPGLLLAWQRVSDRKIAIHQGLARFRTSFGCGHGFLA